MRMPPFVPSSRIGAPPPFSRPSSRRREDLGRFERQSLGVDPAVGDRGRDRGFRVRRQPEADAAIRALELRTAFGQARELHVNAAVCGARLDRARDIAGADATVGRFGDHAPGEAGHLDAAVDRRELGLDADRDTHGVFHLRVAHLEPATAPRQLRFDTNARRRDVLADFDSLDRFLRGRRAGAFGALEGDDLDARPRRWLDFESCR